MEARERLAAQSELTYLKVARRMRIAVQIEEAMEKQHVSKKELAQLMGRQPSEITKWLSGDQNFTSDTLAELSYYLHAKVSYDPSLTLDLPNRPIDFPLSSRRYWKNLKLSLTEGN